MRIQVLLNEEAVAPRAVTYEQLTPQQIHLLKKIHAGRVDIEELDFDELDNVNELMHFGLIDDDYSPTERGMKALAIDKIKGSQQIDAVRQKQQAQSDFDVEQGRSDDANAEPWDAGAVNGRRLAPSVGRNDDEGDEFNFDLGDMDDIPDDDEDMSGMTLDDLD